ncbi:hypothetical protein ALQ47_00428 [Pseudomonas cichorii]|nr:hypothetical protein ALQ47_00428 [Pseudomonas cichorii]
MLPHSNSKREMGIEVIASIRHLISAATTGEPNAEPVAAFLMAWYDPYTYGGFNVTDLWDMEDATRYAVTTLFEWLGSNRTTPQDLELDLVFEAISARWAN